MAQIIQEKMYLNNKKLIDIMNIKIEQTQVSWLSS